MPMWSEYHEEMLPEPPWTWGIVADLNRWGERELALAMAEAEHNGFSPAMYLPLRLYTQVQHHRVDWVEAPAHPEEENDAAL